MNEDQSRDGHGVRAGGSYRRDRATGGVTRIEPASPAPAPATSDAGKGAAPAGNEPAAPASPAEGR